jgi:hypothetical protein
MEPFTMRAFLIETACFLATCAILVVAGFLACFL